jgi:hypothetical protein
MEKAPICWATCVATPDSYTRKLSQRRSMEVSCGSSFRVSTPSLRSHQAYRKMLETQFRGGQSRRPLRDMSGVHNAGRKKENGRQSRA